MDGDPEEGEEVLDVSVARLSGRDRVATAIDASQDRYAASDEDGRRAGAVVLTRSDKFADGLAGTPLAVKLDAPLLLTATAALDARVVDEIDRLLDGDGQVHLLGGPAALDEGIDAEVETAGYTVIRYAGADRYATAADVAREWLGSRESVLLATGRNFPDALAAGNAAALSGAAVLLTDDETLPEATAGYLDDATVAQTYAVGGPAAAAAPDATRLAGADRYATAAAVSAAFAGDPSSVGLATGTAFPDALAGGAHAATVDAPILLTRPDRLVAVTAGYLTEHVDTIDALMIYGGE